LANAWERCACDLLAGASVSNFEKRRPQPAIKLANNLPADAADCEKAVHGGRYAVEVAFRQEFQGCRSFRHRHNLAVTSPRIVKARANFSPVNRRI
jgi:hypothetical protein